MLNPEDELDLLTQQAIVVERKTCASFCSRQHPKIHRAILGITEQLSYGVTVHREMVVTTRRELACVLCHRGRTLRVMRILSMSSTA
jgi:hypothetical protein